MAGKRLAVLTVVLAFAVAPTALAVEPHAGMLRTPDVSATHIAFRYANDLWLVPREGGVATPLSSPPGGERSPRFSPDGRSVVSQGEKVVSPADAIDAAHANAELICRARCIILRLLRDRRHAKRREQGGMEEIAAAVALMIDRGRRASRSMAPALEIAGVVGPDEWAMSGRLAQVNRFPARDPWTR